MNSNIINGLTVELNIKQQYIEQTLTLLEDGNTVPFIARYRKEVTNGLDEEQIRHISKAYEKEVKLADRKIEVKRIIKERATLTEKIANAVDVCTSLADLEAIYLPYKEKKKTRATEAIKHGLQPLADKLLNGESLGDLHMFLNEVITSKEEAIKGAQHIIAEKVSLDIDLSKRIETHTKSYGKIQAQLKKGAVDEKKLFQAFYDYLENIKDIPTHRVMALFRAESEGVISKKIIIDHTKILLNYFHEMVKNAPSEEEFNILYDSVIDSYERLIFPRVERKIFSELKSVAAQKSIQTFQVNLEQLLLQKPLKDTTILALDPAYRTGCKLAVVDPRSRPLAIEVIYPHVPQNKWDASKKALANLCETYNVNIIAIGNGTASRESEKLVAETIKEFALDVQYLIVNESGASVYSASEIAIKEFPDLAVEKRSAISLARRIQDPMAELVKIDPKAIGVGQYQHDVKETELAESLAFTVEKIVNRVGVNLNNASFSLLQYISGLNSTIAHNIVEHRDRNGKFTSRKQLLKVPRLGQKAFEQSAGFLRIIDAKNVLDRTGIHPESYDIASNIVESLNDSLENIGESTFIEKLNNIKVNELSEEMSVCKSALSDIITQLKEPLRDVRDSIPAPKLKSEIVNEDHLEIGMQLEGTVRNVADFGVFVDIGLKNDGMIHISKLTDKFIKHPSEVVKVGDVILTEIIDVDKERHRIGLKKING